MKNILRTRNFYLVLAADIFLTAVSYLLAYVLRFEGRIPAEEWLNIRRSIPFILPVKIGCFFFFGLYRGVWRYTSLIDLFNVIKAALASSTIVMLAILLFQHFQGYSRSVFVIDGFMTFLLIGGLRVAIRMFYMEGVSSPWTSNHRRQPFARKLLIIGAGNAGEKVIREIADNPSLKLDPIGFVDNNRDLLGKYIHGIPVLGTIEDIEILRDDFDEILIAIPSARGEQMRRIVMACERTGKRYRTMPSIGELIGGRLSVKASREVRLEDLIGREEVRLDYDGVRRLLHGTNVLVTGAGGSIGSELVRQICTFEPSRIVLLDVSEYNLFQIEMTCREKFPWIPVDTFLADIRDYDAVRRAFHLFKPKVVFHAAAYKHVPLQEEHPCETVKNNVLGTKNVVNAAVESCVERFVLVSTDKAVRPINVMGATKRVAELLICSMNGHCATRFMAVRFGNVLGSSGSVVPIFQRQIAEGRSVTVTHPEVTRFFMSISEAAQLILQAGAMGEGGEIFILDMGEPVRIVDMARDLIRLHGFEPDVDINIDYIGLRPGEKLYEELITVGEGIVPTEHEKIRLLLSNSNDSEHLRMQIEALLAIADKYDAADIREKLLEIVPEYSPGNLPFRGQKTV